MIAERLYHTAEAKDWFSKYQAGFRKGRSCVDQILRMVQQIDDGFQNTPMKRSVLALLDLSKAYDKVWKEKLLLDMHDKGVPLSILRWIAAFLRNRQAKVRFNNVLGNTKLLKQGLPQGSVLAPILFLFYINSLTERLGDEATISLFADDITILATDGSLIGAQKKVQKVIDIVVQWAKDYKMEISTKSEACFFTTSNNEAKWTGNITAGEVEVNYNPSPRLLGVYVDRQLTFSKHVDEVSKKVNKKCKMLAALANTTWGWKKQHLKKILWNTSLT